MRYKAICFDFDYTLGDATDAVLAGYTYGLNKMGWPTPEREAVRRTIGLMLEDGYTMLTGDEDPEHRRQFRPLFVEVADALQRTGTRLFPGGEELLRSLHGQGIRLGIISSKRTSTLRAILDNRGILELMGLVIGSDAVTRHKPDPEGIYVAMERLSVTREELLYCGDTMIDAGTARAAGVDFCGVLNGTTTAEELKTLPHVHIAPDLWELARWLEERKE